jgi:preprotein translocase subunit YajC
MPTLIFAAVVFLFAWVFLVLPAKRRQRAHRAMQDSVTAGDEIITAGGIHGVLRDVGDDEAQLEIAPGVVVKIDRRAIAAVARDVPAITPGEPDEADG